MKDLENHRASQIFRLLFSYAATKDILASNSFEVLRFIEQIESGRFSQIAFDPTQRQKYAELENHLIRYFHNFLAAAKTLVDHTRNLMKSKLISEAHLASYQEYVKMNFGDELSKFVNDFRNFILHFGLPRIAHVCELQKEQWSVALNLSEIKDWDGWTAKSKAFFRTQPDEIRLAWVVAVYQQKVNELHLWLINSFNEHYSEIFRDFEELRAASLPQPSI